MVGRALEPTQSGAELIVIKEDQAVSKEHAYISQVAKSTPQRTPVPPVPQYPPLISRYPGNPSTLVLQYSSNPRWYPGTPVEPRYPRGTGQAAEYPEYSDGGCRAL
jgi:hypothetical protein